MSRRTDTSSALALGNAACRVADWAEAVRQYELALQQQPIFAPMITANLALARRYLSPEDAKTLSAESGSGYQTRDVIILWKQNDSGLYGRRHEMVAQYFAARRDVRKVLLFDYPITTERMRQLGRAGGEHTHRRLLYELTRARLRGALDTAVLKQRVLVFDGQSIEPARWVAWVREVLAAEEIDAGSTLLVVYPHHALAQLLCDALRPWRLLVDVVDDPRTRPAVSDAALHRMNVEYRELLARADVVWTNCEEMREAVRGWFALPQLVPNGCDLDSPQQAPAETAVFERFRSWPGPTLGYVGNLESKLDLDLLERLAVSFPHCQLALIGSAHTSEAALGLRRFPNVCMPGVVPYAEVGAWVRHFDVGLLPHRDTEMTRRMHPLKQYLYLRYRVPVVASGISNLEDWPGWVFRTESTQGFLKCVQELVAYPSVVAAAEETAFSARLAAVSWQSRLKSAVDGLLGASDC